jgi:hypothetical protein
MSQTIPFQEKFDLNQVQLSGVVLRAWSAGPDILVRLALAAKPEESDAPDNQPTSVVLRLPQGCVGGEAITILTGDHVLANGYLADAPYIESGQQFAERSRKDLLETLPGLGAVTTERVSTHMVVTALDFLPGAPSQPVNAVTVEGVVSRAWEHRGQRFARLAVYDSQTEADGRLGKNGRPWRKAHYVSVHFPDGRVDGRVVNVQQKDRLRVHGKLGERRYRETLATFLLRAGKIGMLSDVPNADTVREARVSRSATYVTAHALIQFSR